MFPKVKTPKPKKFTDFEPCGINGTQMDNHTPIERIRASRLDGVAVFLSGTCMVHCLLFPVIVTLFPIVQGSLMEEQYFHLIMLVLILPVSLVALTIGCRKHRDMATICLGATGLITLTITALMGHELFSFMGERIATSIGGIILASAHIQNYRCCRKVDCQHEE